MGMFGWLHRKRKDSESVSKLRGVTAINDAIAKLSDISDEERVGKAIELLKASDFEVRAAVASAIARLEIKSVGVWYELTNTLTDDHESVCLSSAKAFWQLGGVDYAIRSLRDEYEAPAHMSKSDALKGINFLRDTSDDQFIFNKLIKENWPECPQISSIKDVKKEEKIKTNAVQDLENLRIKISQLPKKYPVEGKISFGNGLTQAQEQIPIICMNIEQAIRALKTGFDPNNNPITKPLIADGLKNLIKATRKPEFIGLLSTILNFDGIQRLERYINELEQISNKIRSGEAKPEARFIAHGKSTVIDTETGLEWYAKPHKNTSWYKAKSWAENLAVDGGSWRMPSRVELKTLYKKGAEKQNMTPLIKTKGRGWLIWSREIVDSSSAWVFDFPDGKFYRGGQNARMAKGFAVRSRK